MFLLVIIGSTATLLEFKSLIAITSNKNQHLPENIIYLFLGVLVRLLYPLVATNLYFSYEKQLNIKILKELDKISSIDRGHEIKNDLATKILTGSQLIALNLISPIAMLIQLFTFIVFGLLTLTTSKAQVDLYLVIMPIGLLFIIYYALTKKIIVKSGEARNKALKQRYRTLISFLNSYQMLKFADLKKYTVLRFIQSSNTYKNSQVIMTFLNSSSRNFIELMGIAVLIILIQLDNIKLPTLDEMVAVGYLAYRCVPLMSAGVQAAAKINSIQSNIEDLQGLFSVLTAEQPANLKKRTPLRITNDGDNIKFKSSSIELLLKPSSHHRIKGKSGCGKSTLLNAFTGVSNHQYEVHIDTITKKYLNRNIFYVSDEKLEDDWNVYEFLTAELDIKKLNEIEPLLASLGVQKDQTLPLSQLRQLKMKDFSTGERQRLLLARGFLLDKNIWLLDEATANLDKQMELEIYGLLKKLPNKSIITITHSELPDSYFTTVTNVEDVK